MNKMLYDPASGVFTAKVFTETEVIDHTDNHDGRKWLNGLYDMDTQFLDIPSLSVVNKTTPSIIVDKTNITANGVDKATISGIPVGTIVKEPYANRNNRWMVIDDGLLEFTTNIPSYYKLVFINGYYLKMEVTIVAT